ncbi:MULTISPECIES: acyl-CoA dehydrogenase family protein [unclassified Pseudomonas]|uniref:acyl-CoA dehydrogenase family protein n=1 Tax=unclassified Pseudomonas TaxID=196821 RepID=UPI0021C949E8|nr:MULTISPECIES: acyl-CoA dehydrogenase family protein [unclassified Pseudomonas]MCU1735080.1 acyl-CoA dehydrogenase family protein [Pseudomonas sp. 20P_3.2_Bac4]MCU1743555.1 acyl-CoA dehydrogenase family protein [Pseudomonas sp. 20P_3.2_Bac5]
MNSVSAVPPTVTLEQLNARIDQLLPVIGAGASQRERDRQLPYEAVAQLAKAGLFTARIPASHGGAGASVKDVIALLIRIASVDSNVAQALRPGFGFLEGLLASNADGAEAERERWFARYLQGAVIGNAGWEVGGASGTISARIVAEGDHYRATGSKFYSTGALYADWVSAMALDDNEQPVTFIIPSDRQGLELLDDFDAMGQRLTASGTTHLRGVVVHRDEICTRIVEEGKRTIVTPFLQLFLAAVQAGIARNALNDAVNFTNQHARPIKHSSASRSVDDPYVQFSVGEVSARAFTAEAVVLRAAETIDRAWASGLDTRVVDQAAVDVAQAQYIAAESALKAAELIFDVGGASTTGRTHNLDRHWRNARTVANHNPRQWKAAVVGAWQLSGTPPPTSGLF